MQRTLQFISLFIPFLLILSIIGFVGLEKITQVECVLQGNSCPPETTQLLDQLRGQKLFFSDLSVVAANALQSNPEVQVESFARVWPTTVKVTLKHSQPVYAVSTQDQNWVVTQDGFLIKTPENVESIPKVFITDRNLLTNDTLSQQLHERLALLIHSLEAEDIPYQEIEVHSEERIILVMDSRNALLSLDSPAYDSKRLSLVLKGLEPDKLDTVREIDLRYKFPVLRNQSTVPRQKSQ